MSTEPIYLGLSAAQWAEVLKVTGLTPVKTSDCIEAVVRYRQLKPNTGEIPDGSLSDISISNRVRALFFNASQLGAINHGSA